MDDAPIFTARMAAGMRAAHCLIDDPPIFRDELALQFSGLAEAELLEIVAAGDPSLASVFRLTPVVRARAADEILTEAIAHGVKQFVILGAGMDSTAWRRADLAPTVTTFEVDHPSTQQYKKERVALAGVEAHGEHRFVPFDFTTDDDFVRALIQAGLDATRPVLWSWLGVLTYLTEDQILRTLSAMATTSMPGSEVIMDFILDPELLDDRARAADEFARPMAASRGEPYISVFRPDEISALADRSGWRIKQCSLPEDYRSWFDGRTDSLHWSTYIGIAVARRPE
jgi:methyltransferase (TIGR00027 family)